MSLALYRKYRPQIFREFIGQNHIRVTLQNEIETDKVAHAYIFSGPRGIGKTTAARLVAKAVNCLKRKKGESEPCNTCESCREIKEGRSLDIVEIDAASHTGVDNVRENIINNARFTPTKRKYKVFIIDEVHMLSTPAFNALLKTIEEPPSYVIFILATTEIYKIPATIISRCQRFDFKKVNLKNITERLNLITKREGIQIDSKILEDIARHADGSIRDAESLLDQVLALADTSKKISKSQAELVIPQSDFGLVTQFAEILISHDAEAGFRFINTLVEEGRDLGQFLQDFIEILRKILLAGISDSLSSFSMELNEDIEKKILDLSKKIKTENLISIIELLMEKKKEIRFADIPQLPLELAVVEICGTSQEKQGPQASDKVQEINPVRNIISNGVKDTKESKARPASSGQKVFEEVKKKWPEILEKVSGYNHSLPLVLRMGQPIGFEDDVLQIGFKYRFHKEKANERRSKEILEKAIKEIFKVNLSVNSVIADVPEPPKIETKTSEGNVEEILKEFGGRVVE